MGGKTVINDKSTSRLDAPRDRESSPEPQIIDKDERRFKGYDQKIAAMYARGILACEIQGHLAEMYGTEVLSEFNR
jgi:putative transposase